MNETGSKLAEALVKVQAALGSVEKNKENPFFKSSYADLAGVINHAKKVLAANGLAVLQYCEVSDKGNVLVTELLHISGENRIGKYLFPAVKHDPQGEGSALTYARRYGYMAIVGLAAEDEDDDGNAGSKGEAKQTQDAPKKPAPQAAPAEKKPFLQDDEHPVISEKQAKRLFAIARGAGWTPEQMKDWLIGNYGVEHSRNIKRQDYDKICEAMGKDPAELGGGDAAEPAAENDELPMDA